MLFKFSMTMSNDTDCFEHHLFLNWCKNLKRKLGVAKTSLIPIDTQANLTGYIPYVLSTFNFLQIRTYFILAYQQLKKSHSATFVLYVTLLVVAK